MAKQASYAEPLLQVIDLISLKPFDLEAITKSIKKTRKCIIVEECMKTGGIGASLSAVINESLFNELDHEVRWANGYLFPALQCGAAPGILMQWTCLCQICVRAEQALEAPISHALQ